MVTLFLTSLSLELDNSTPRFCESVYGIFQSFRCASSIRPGSALDRVAQQMGDVVLVYLSASQLGGKSTPQVMPDQTTLNCETELNPRSFTGFRQTASKRAGAHSCVVAVKYASRRPALDDVT
jgi:hypothetical protein